MRARLPFDWLNSKWEWHKLRYDMLVLYQLNNLFLSVSLSTSSATLIEIIEHDVDIPTILFRCFAYARLELLLSRALNNDI